MRHAVLAGLIALALSSCGGDGGYGGGGTSPPPPPPPATAPPAPVLSLEPQAVKAFHFSWVDVEGETEYRLLENADGSSGYALVATIPADAETHDHEVFLPARVNASYILDACNAVGCTGSQPVFVDGALGASIGYVKASNTGASDDFGFAVALSGDGSTLAVGAPLEDSAATGVGGDQGDNSADSSGAVYVFTRDAGGAWTQRAYVKASNTGAGDGFGFAVALSDDGTTLVVGADGEDSAATGVGGDQDDNSAGGSGAAYVFVRDADVWTQQAYLKATNTGAGDNFGLAVALSGDGATLAVGAPLEDGAATGIGGDQSDDSASNSGAVYLFDRNPDGVWSQEAYVKASNTGGATDDDPLGDAFGFSVALSGDGNTLVVGASRENSAATGVNGDQGDNSARDSGAAYVFTREGGAWSEQAIYIKASNTGEGDGFGGAVAVSNDGAVLVVGAAGEDSAATGVGGDQGDESASNSGAAYVFAREGGAWSQQAYVKASNTDPFDRFGGAVVLSDDGDLLVVGASLEDSAATGVNGDQGDNSAGDGGAVYPFARDGGAWSQQAYVKASNTEAGGEGFGLAVALSGDGTTLAAGATGEDSAAVGVGGDQGDNTAQGSGAVYLY